MKKSNTPYEHTGAALICDSINQIGSRLSTFVVYVPPYLIDTISRLPRAVATPIWWGMDVEQLIAEAEFLDTPYNLMGMTTEFGAKLMVAEWKASRERCLTHLNQIASVANKPDKALVQAMIQPFVLAHFVITATEWETVILAMRDTDDPVLNILATKISEALDGTQPIQLDEDAWHAPFITINTLEEIAKDAEHALKHLQMRVLDLYDRSMHQAQLVSLARCARGGPINIDGSEASLHQEIERANALLKRWPMYDGAAAHMCAPSKLNEEKQFECTTFQGEFFGWDQLRLLWRWGGLDRENVMPIQTPEPAMKFELIQGGRSD